MNMNQGGIFSENYPIPERGHILNRWERDLQQPPDTVLKRLEQSNWKSQLSVRYRWFFPEYIKPVSLPLSSWRLCTLYITSKWIYHGSIILAEKSNSPTWKLKITVIGHLGMMPWIHSTSFRHHSEVMIYPGIPLFPILNCHASAVMAWQHDSWFKHGRETINIWNQRDVLITL
jgi:hypothetical protein